MRHKIIYIILTALLLNACGSYQRLLKSGTVDEKYTAAKSFFNAKEYVKSATLFADIISFYRGAKESEEIMFLLAESYMGQEDYYSAAAYYKDYVKSYPRGEFAAQCKYMIGYCYFLDVPDPRLDQDLTIQAVNALTEYIELYPEGEKANDAYRYIAELNDKLAYKGLLNAKLYLNLGIYLGNNYRSAIITAEQALKDYPDTKFREDLSFVILSAKYKEAALSVPEKRAERYSEVIDEFYKYSVEFPDGKNSREASRILKEAKHYASIK
ncbi:MAG: outer membrane protein assembly factor BamD [Prevotellaceae bacterium]|jgi:outer membrane protein assembly factor BamD|nr:outer membrane protein assembly factor BamD [Prevotellaceae bacterium]